LENSCSIWYSGKGVWNHQDWGGKIVVPEYERVVFATDQELFSELVSFKIKEKPLGVVLVSSNNSCINCNSKLVLQKDQPAQVIIYDDINGSMPGSHYLKYCKNRSCGFSQYYGYYTNGGSSNVYYNSDWISLTYFVSSRETVYILNELDDEAIWCIDFHWFTELQAVYRCTQLSPCLW